jgi:hypothetical protein
MRLPQANRLSRLAGVARSVQVFKPSSPMSVSS